MASSSCCPTLWCCSSGVQPLWHCLAPPGSNLHLHLTLELPGCALGAPTCMLPCGLLDNPPQPYGGNCRAGGMPRLCNVGGLQQTTSHLPRTYLRRAGWPAADAQGCCNAPTATLLVGWRASTSARVPLPAVLRLQRATQCDPCAGAA